MIEYHGHPEAERVAIIMGSGIEAVTPVVDGLVADASAADFALNLSSPPTVDIGCGALDTGGTWSCRVGNQVFLNVDRWWFATPTWNGYLLDDYRAYMINHEVGHYLGFGHLTCPEPGALSPVMQQQSIYLNECLPNPWPDVTGERDG